MPIPGNRGSRKKVLVRDRTWFVRLYGEIIPSFSEGIIDRTDAQTMLYLSCTMTSRVDFAHFGVSHAKDWVSVDCGTTTFIISCKFTRYKSLF